MSNKVNVFTPLGATNHSKGERAESDFYSTDPQAIYLLHKHNLLDDKRYWECACGGGGI